MNYYLDAIKEYVAFNGRARRKQYWMFQLFHGIIILALAGLDHAMGTLNLEMRLGLLSGIYLLATLAPNLSITVQRLHDTNNSGWWLLISLIPLVGPLVLLIFMVFDGTNGQNQYGPNPKENGTPLPA